MKMLFPEKVGAGTVGHPVVLSVICLNGFTLPLQFSDTLNLSGSQKPKPLTILSPDLPSQSFMLFCLFTCSVSPDSENTIYRANEGWESD